jgi:TPR repeat protein
MYEKGEGMLEKDTKRAMEWYKVAAEAGDVQAQACLAELLEKQRGRDESVQARGHPPGEGKAAAEAEQTTKDEQEAFAWWLKAARRGNAEAQFHVGRMLAGGKGTAKDVQQVRRQSHAVDCRRVLTRVLLV